MSAVTRPDLASIRDTLALAVAPEGWIAWYRQDVGALLAYVAELEAESRCGGLDEDCDGHRIILDAGPRCAGFPERDDCDEVADG